MWDALMCTHQSLFLQGTRCAYSTSTQICPVSTDAFNFQVKQTFCELKLKLFHEEHDDYSDDCSLPFSESPSFKKGPWCRLWVNLQFHSFFGQKPSGTAHIVTTVSFPGDTWCSHPLTVESPVGCWGGTLVDLPHSEVKLSAWLTHDISAGSYQAYANTLHYHHVLPIPTPNCNMYCVD